jgi:hypothetical protein
VRLGDDLQPAAGSLIEQMLAMVEPTEEAFEIELGPMTLPFRGIADLSEFRALWDKAREFESTIRNPGLRPRTIAEDLVPSYPGIAATAQFLASVCMHPEMQDPLPWLILQKKAGLMFSHIGNAVDAHLSVRLKVQENQALETAKKGSRRRRRTGTASS